MAAIGFSRGHLLVCYDGIIWRYFDSGAVHDDLRSCYRCHKLPTPEGYDACLGHILGAVSACCGHGVGELSIVMANIESIRKGGE